MQQPVSGQLARLARNAGTYGLGQALAQIGAFLLLPLFTSYLSKADYGIIGLLATLSFVATPVFSLGFGTSIGACYFEGNREERKAATIWTSFAILFISSLLLTSVAIILPVPISRLALGNADHGWLVALTLFTSVFEILSTPGRVRLQFEERARLFVALTLLSTLGSIALSVVLVVGAGRGALGMIEARLIGQGLAFVLFSAATLPTLPRTVDAGLGRELLRLGIPLIPSFLFVFALSQSNRYILQWLKGLDAVGIYTVGHNMGQAMNLVVGAFQMAWFPYFMSFTERRDEARVLFGRVFTYYIFGCGSLSLLFFVFARPATLLMTQPDFHAAYQIVGLVACGMFLSAAFLVLLPGMYFQKELKMLVFIQFAAVLVGTVVTVACTWLLGLVGAGLGLVAGYLALTAIQALWNRHRRDRYLVVDYEWSRLIPFALLYIGFAVAMAWPRQWSVATEVVASIGATVLLVALVFGLSTSGERETLRRWIGRGR